MAVTVYLDETGTHVGASRIMIGAVVTRQPTELERVVTLRREELAADRSLWPDSAKRPMFAAEGFHHSTDDETIRDRFIETMQTLDFRAHVCYSRRGINGLDDDDLLVVMHYAVVRNLLRRYAGQEVSLVFETKSEMDSLYGRIVKHAVESLDSAYAPRASAWARIGDQPLGGLSVADYVLALTELHLQQQSGDQVQPFRVARFARIASHMAHLIDFDAAANKRKLARML